MGICLWLQWRNFLFVADGDVWEDLQCVDNGDVNCVAFYVVWSGVFGRFGCGEVIFV